MENRNAFIGAPFADYIEPATGKLYEDKKLMLLRIIQFVESKGFTVDNSHVREDWGENWMPPEICTPLDYEKIKEADIFIAIPGNPPSGGVHIELGWASALKTRVIMLLEKDKKYSNLVLGLGTIGEIEYIHYETLEDCFDKLGQIM